MNIIRNSDSNQSFFEIKIVFLLIVLVETELLCNKLWKLGLRYPMTKAMVNAMTVVQHFMKTKANIQVKEFMISGASKRGWNTYTTVAVDSRVTAMAPLVIFLFKIKVEFEHYFYFVNF